jgi:hypothetical protein
MSKTGRTWALLLMSIPLACSSKSSLKLLSGDGSVTNRDAEPGDASASAKEDGKEDGKEDAKAPVSDVLLPADLAFAPDVVTNTPDIRRSDGVSGPADVVADLGRNDDTATPVQPDGKAPADDTGAVFYADGKAPPDGAVVYADGNSTPDAMVFYSDGKVAPDAGADTIKADAGKDLGPQIDAGIIVSGVEVIQYAEYGSADTACVQGTTSWLSTLTTYLPEDRKCWADSDCQYVSFSNLCGQVCPVPMNTQRIGEFAQHAIGDLDPKCATCPVLTDFPRCPAPPGDGSVICSNNLCVWK